MSRYPLLHWERVEDLATRDDLTLFRAWRTGDREAGNELGRRYFRGVYRFFRAKVPEAAEDLTQRAFLGCVEGREQIRQASFRAYLFGVARKQLLRYFEGRVERFEAGAASQRSIVDLQGSPSQVVAAREQHALLLEALQRIPVDFQIAVELFYWEGLSLAEIADALDVKVGTVKSRLSRAKGMLRVELAALGARDDLDLEHESRLLKDSLTQ